MGGMLMIANKIKEYTTLQGRNAKKILNEEEQENVNKRLLIAIEGGIGLVLEPRRVKNLRDIKKLLEDGANPNAKHSRWGDTALMEAACYGRDNVVKMLLKYGADSNNENHGLTALMYAAAWGRKKSVRILLRNGADPNAKDNDGRTALIKIFQLTSDRYPITKEQQDIIKVLVKNGANTDIEDTYGCTARDYGVKLSHFDAVDTLDKAILEAAKR